LLEAKNCIRLDSIAPSERILKEDHGMGVFQHLGRLNYVVIDFSS
jgi:hypothetical protein